MDEFNNPERWEYEEERERIRQAHEYEEKKQIQEFLEKRFFKWNKYNELEAPENVLIVGVWVKYNIYYLALCYIERFPIDEYIWAKKITRMDYIDYKNIGSRLEDNETQHEEDALPTYWIGLPNELHFILNKKEA